MREFDWDEAKALANAEKHDVSFHVAIAVFADPRCLDYDVSRAKDMEFRRKAVGVIDDRLVTVVYTLRGTTCRVISARRSNPNEERRYDDHQSDA